MLKTKLPSSRLCLTYVFELPAERTASPSPEAHDVAIKKAAQISGLVSKDIVAATASSLKDVSLANVHKLPFKESFFVKDGGPALRCEFYYGSDTTKTSMVAVRIVTSLGEEPSMIIDGVLASRIAFYTMELLDGNDELSTGSPAAREGSIPTLKFGFRQQINFLREIPGTLLLIIYTYLYTFFVKLLGIKEAPSDPTLVHDPKTLFRFYESSRANELAELQAYRPEVKDYEKPFRKFLQVVDNWRNVRGLVGYFYLINFSPLVASGVTSNIQDIVSYKRRYRNAFDRPNRGPTPPMWRIVNPQLSRRIFINNYGIHVHSFKAKPLAYVWDWLEMAAPLHGAGCITLNGVFMAWFRGMPAALEQGDLSSWMGEPIARVTQNDVWFKCMGLPRSIAPAKQEIPKEMSTNAWLGSRKNIDKDA